jgi:hypothetical protein
MGEGQDDTLEVAANHNFWEAEKMAFSPGPRGNAIAEKTGTKSDA